LQLSLGTIVDRYTVESLIGKGGMATVYKVRHSQLGTYHALKVLDIPVPSIRQRLMQEGRLQGALHHPNVVAVTDVVQVGESPALVLELVRGPSLADLLANEALTIAQADELAQGLLRGVAAAHRHGLIHRDLKPGNILLSISDDGIVPKITDFGLARIVADDTDVTRHTRSGVAMGTPAYMSPEQIKDTKSVDSRTDVFSLGCVLYEMLAERRAFDGENVVEIFNQIVSGDYPPLHEIRNGVPDRMVDAIVGALQIDSEKRIGSVVELQDIWRGGEAPARTSGWDHHSLSKARSLTSESDVAANSAVTFAATYAQSIPDNQPSQPTLATSTVAQPNWRQAALYAAAVTIASVPIGYGAMTATYADSLEMGGHFAKLVLLVGALGMGALTMLTAALKSGRATVWGAWLLMPAAVIILGALGTTIGNLVAMESLSGFDRDEVGIMAAYVVATAITTEMSALDVACGLFLCTAAAVAWAYRSSVEIPPSPSLSPRGWASLIVGFVLGLAMWWFHESRVIDGGPMPFLVFVGLSGTSICCAITAYPSTSRVGTNAKIIISLSTVFATWTGAKCVLLLDELWAHQQLAESAPKDRYAAAESLQEAFIGGNHDLVIGWVAVASIVAIIPLYGKELHLTGLRWPRQLIGLGLPLTATVAVASVAWSQSTATHTLILPSFLTESAHFYFGRDLTDSELAAAGATSRKGTDVAFPWAALDAALAPADMPRGVLVQSELDNDPLKLGDTIVTVGGMPVDTVRELVGVVRSCLCDREQPLDACPIDACVHPGQHVDVAVMRDGKLVNTSLAVLLSATPTP
jgi:serine/threonine protein kinase